MLVPVYSAHYTWPGNLYGTVPTEACYLTDQTGNTSPECSTLYAFDSKVLEYPLFKSSVSKHVIQIFTQIVSFLLTSVICWFSKTSDLIFLWLLINSSTLWQLLQHSYYLRYVLTKWFFHFLIGHNNFCPVHFLHGLCHNVFSIFLVMRVAGQVPEMST